MTVVESSSKNKLLDSIATGVTVISEGTSAGPFKTLGEMRIEFEKLNVNGYDKVGEKPDEVSN